MSSQFSSGEVLSIIVAWIVLSVAITYQKLVGLLTVAIRRGYLAHFRLWIWGLVLTISIVTISGGGLVFGAPGAVYISPSAAGFYGYNSSRGSSDPEEDNMIISAAGPGINLGFAIGFLALLFSVPVGFLYTVAFFGLLLNVGLGSFNMLPVPPLDGSKIFRKSVPVALAIALPLWVMFITFHFII